MASVLANEFAEATDALYLSSLFCIGFVLFVVTFLINAGARWLVYKTMSAPSGGRE